MNQQLFHRPVTRPGLTFTLRLSALLLGAVLPAQAQWLTQTNILKPGWNAVFLHVDASHDTLENLVGLDPANPILEVWLWSPASSTMQFVQSPQEPVATSSQWVSWLRSASGSSPLQRLLGNAAYLVRVDTTVASYSWNVKGRPVAPRYQWTTSGLNFLGFPTVPVNPPMMVNFLPPALRTGPDAQIFQYVGGNLGATNPARVYAVNTTPVRRGQAFWIRSGTTYNRYFAPFEVALAGELGVEFGTDRSASTFRLRNLHATNLTVTLQLAASETPPVGQSNIVAVPPLLLRGDLNFTNLTYGYTNLPVGSPRTWTLAGQGLPGSEVEVVLGLDRTAMGGSVGDLQAGILYFTDSLGHARVDVPVSATVASNAGLWVGGATVSQVSQYLKTYLRDSENKPITTTNGNYLVTSTNTALNAVPQTYPLRLILHNPAAGNAVLLQRVYVGLGAATNAVVASGESALHAGFLKAARRISATHLPWTATNTVWTFDGRLGAQTNLSTTVALAYDDQPSNPFLHTYHPDHDNLDARFKNVLPQGSESYAVERAITLNVQPPADDFSSRVAAAETRTGEYLETITLKGLGASARAFQVSGAFTLNRVSQVPALTLAP